MENYENKKIRELTKIKAFLGFIVAVIFAIILKILSDIFIPLVFSLLLYFFFNGMMKKFQKLKISRNLSLIMIILIILIVFYLFGLLIYLGISSFIHKFPSYSDKITKLIKNILDYPKLSFLDIQNYVESIEWAKTIDAGKVTKVALSAFGSFSSIMGNIILIFTLLISMLAGRNILTQRIGNAFNKTKTSKIISMINSIEDQVQFYLKIKILLNLLISVLVGLILLFAGFDFIIFTVLLFFLLNFIPNVGPVLSMIFPIIIGIINFGFSTKFFVVMIFLVLIQFILANFLESKITGKSLNLSPIMIIFSLILWSYLWGIAGLILAVPLTSSIKIFMQNSKSLKPIAKLISAK